LLSKKVFFGFGGWMDGCVYGGKSCFLGMLGAVQNVLPLQAVYFNSVSDFLWDVKITCVWQAFLAVSQHSKTFASILINQMLFGNLKFFCICKMLKSEPNFRGKRWSNS
jgi:hypothetical protein